MSKARLGAGRHTGTNTPAEMRSPFMLFLRKRRAAASQRLKVRRLEKQMKKYPHLVDNYVFEQAKETYHTHLCRRYKRQASDGKLQGSDLLRLVVGQHSAWDIPGGLLKDSTAKQRLRSTCKGLFIALS